MQDYLDSYGYAAIVCLTFLEGETIVILAGIAAYQGYMNIYLVAAAAFAGSFSGDQLYFTLGRRYGSPLLDRWPEMSKKIDWAFDLVRRYETLYILSFRFVYGVRNVSPFVFGISGVSRLKFILLNSIAAAAWASAFAAGGFFFGHALEKALGEHQTKGLMILAGVGVIVGIVMLIRGKLKRKSAPVASPAAPLDGGDSAAG